MAHFARVSDGVVVNIHVVKNCAIGGCVGPDHLDYGNGQHESCGNLDFPEQEPLGQAFLSALHGGHPSDYVQCSYNARFRGCYPPIGFIWNGVEFISPPDVPEPQPS